MLFRSHCAEEIGNSVRKLEGIIESDMNFLNKKLTVLFDSNYNEEEVIKSVIKKIDSIEPGLNIEVVEKKLRKQGRSRVVTQRSKKLENKKELILGGLTCAHCAEVIGTEVAKMEGIKSSNLNFVNKKLSLEFNENINKETLIKEIIAKIDSIEPGLDIQINDDKKHSIDLNAFANSTHKQQKVEHVKETKNKVKTLLNSEKANLIKLISGALIFMFAFYQEATGKEASYSIFIFILSYIIIGGDVLYKAFRNITRGRVFDENFLITVATIGAIATGESSEAVGVKIGRAHV